MSGAVNTFYHIYSTLSQNLFSQIVTVCLLLIFWSILYTLVNTFCNFKSLSVTDSNDVKNRIISIVHGVSTFWLATSQYIPKAIFDQHNTNFQTFICLFSLSYCIYDLLACIYYKLYDFALVSHHTFCILGFGFAAFSGYGAIDSIGGLFVAEVSNFWMHSRVILRIFNLKNTKSYEYSQNIYLASYILFRGILCPFIVWYPCVISNTSHLIVKFMCTALVLQSYYFIFQMVGIAKKKISRNKQMKEKKIQFKWFSQNKEQLQKLSFYKKKDATKIF